MSDPDPNCPKCQGDGVIPSANWDGLPRVECECIREKAEQEVRLQNDRDWRAKLDHVKSERDAWRDECFRVRALCKTFDKETADEALTADDVIAALKDHRFVHADWATWFEANPDDPRAKGGVGDAAFHRAAVARYDRLIAAVATLRTRLAELEAERDRLREALAPFSQYAAAFATNVTTLFADDDEIWKCPRVAPLTLGDMRRAFLAQTKEPSDDDDT